MATRHGEILNTAHIRYVLHGTRLHTEPLVQGTPAWEEVRRQLYLPGMRRAANAFDTPEQAQGMMGLFGGLVARPDCLLLGLALPVGWVGLAAYPTSVLSDAEAVRILLRGRDTPMDEESYAAAFVTLLSAPSWGRFDQMRYLEALGRELEHVFPKP